MTGGERLDRRNPFQVYRDARIFSVLRPYTHHGSKVRENTIKDLHNAAAKFLLQQEGTEETPDGFNQMRSRISAMVAEDMSHYEKNDAKPALGPQISKDLYYKRVGD